MDLRLNKASPAGLTRMLIQKAFPLTFRENMTDILTIGRGLKSSATIAVKPGVDALMGIISIFEYVI
jgi:hypothetical protein